jgi:hypothetical protein
MRAMCQVTSVVCFWRGPLSLSLYIERERERKIPKFLWVTESVPYDVRNEKVACVCNTTPHTLGG